LFGSVVNDFNASLILMRNIKYHKVAWSCSECYLKLLWVVNYKWLNSLILYGIVVNVSRY